MKPWTLDLTTQCSTCPWRKDVDPHDIPDGYTVDRHRNLVGTIANPDDVISQLASPDFHIMTCHLTEKSPCIGWIHNQVYDGNNLRLRIALRNCTNAGEIQVVGEQHELFEDTIPED